MVRAQALTKLFHNGRLIQAGKAFNWTGEVPPPRHVRLLEEPPEGYQPERRRAFRPRFRTDPRYPYGQPRAEELADGSAPSLGTPLPDRALEIMAGRAKPVRQSRPSGAGGYDPDYQRTERVGAGSAPPPPVMTAESEDPIEDEVVDDAPPAPALRSRARQLRPVDPT